VVVGDFGNLLNLRFADEALEVEVGAVDFEDEGGLRGEGLLVVAEMGFIGGTDFDKFGSGGLENFWDAKSAADFHEFGPGDDDFIFALGDEGAEGEDESGGAVVDGGSGFSFEEAGEGGFEISSPFASGSGGEVELEIGVSGCDGLECAGGAGAERGASKIGMDEDAGGVDHGLEAGVGKLTKTGLDCGLDGFARVLFIGEQELAEAIDFATDEEVDQGAWKRDIRRESGGEFLNGRKGGEFTHEY